MIRRWIVPAAEHAEILAKLETSDLLLMDMGADLAFEQQRVRDLEEALRESDDHFDKLEENWQRRMNDEQRAQVHRSRIRDGDASLKLMAWKILAFIQLAGLVIIAIKSTPSNAFAFFMTMIPTTMFLVLAVVYALLVGAKTVAKHVRSVGR